MFIFRLCAIAVITAVSAFILKSHNSQLVPLCLIAGGIILFLSAFDYLTQSVDFLRLFAENTGIDNGIVRIIFKVIGIGFIVELTAGSVKELGFEGVADKLLLCGKIIIFVVSIPILSGAYQLILSLIKLA